MKKNISLIFLLSVILFSCTKKEIVNSGNSPIEISTLSNTLSPYSTTPNLQLNLNYFASASQLNSYANIVWPTLNPPTGSELAAYTMRFTITGQQTIHVGINTYGASCNTTISFSSPTMPLTLQVKAELIKNNAVISSTSESLTILPVIDASSPPPNPIATVSLNRPDPGYPQYYIKASNLSDLNGHPEKKLYFYAFYFPTEYQRAYLQKKTEFLGHVAISGSTSFPTEGGFWFYLPDDGSPVSNIRVFITKTEYPLSYFTISLMNTGYEDYLIDWCTEDVAMYSMPFQGLNTTNGQFSSSSYPSLMSFEIGSMDPMLNIQIYYLKGMGRLW